MKKVQWTFDSEAENKQKVQWTFDSGAENKQKVRWTFDSGAENKNNACLIFVYGLCAFPVAGPLA
ncbi:MAG: hypothetical protein IJU81_06385 [Bacteroidales bacterium]|nr:hypothetical protein [Bacteroidales bacterium]